jgi:membrane protease YdiL (CAAX protease family)
LIGFTGLKGKEKYFMTDLTTNEIHQSPLIKYGWLRAILFLVAALVTTAILSFIGMMVVAVIFGIDPNTLITDAKNILKDLGLPANITISLFGFIGMFFTVWIFRRFIDKKSIKSLGFSFSPFKNDFYIGLILGIILISIGFAILSASGMLSVIDTNINIALLIGYVALFVIASFNEEIMIRGYILNNLCDSMNQYIALIISSLLFSVMHLGNANVTILSFINIFLAGILLGIYYIHKRNLWLPIALHFSWNFFQGPVYGFEVSGVDISGIITQDLQGSDTLTGGPFGFEGSIIATVLMILAILFLHYKYKKMDQNTVS